MMRSEIPGCFVARENPDCVQNSKRTALRAYGVFQPLIKLRNVRNGTLSSVVGPPMVQRKQGGNYGV
jgi:hypothetical protein